MRIRVYKGLLGFIRVYKGLGFTPSLMIASGNAVKQERPKGLASSSAVSKLLPSANKMQRQHPSAAADKT